MKYFIEVLLEKKLIKREMLLQAIIEQISKTPSPSEIAFRNQLISNEKLIEVCFHQSRENTSFQASCQVLNIWTKELEVKIREEMEKKTPSLAQILVQKGFITHTQMTETFDQFINGKKTEDKAPSVAVVKQPLTPSLEDPMLNELLSEDWIDEVQKTVQKITLIANDDELKTIFESLKQDFHKIRGIGRFVKAAQIEHLAESMETLLINTAKSKIESTQLKAVAEALEKNLTFVSECNRKVA